MIDWIISLFVVGLSVALAFIANKKFGKQRADGRPHQVPWGLVMVGCAFAVVLAVVHMANLIGVDTGPGKGLLGRF